MKISSTLSEEEARRRIDAVHRHGSFAAAAQELGIASGALRLWYRDQERRGVIKPPDITPPVFPDDDLPIEEIIAQMEKRYTKRAEAHRARVWFPIKVNIEGPVGVLWYGDPHLDDNGCNWPLLKRHIEVAKQPGVFGANIGDSTNNWSGRLARLFADQETSQATARKLARWFLLDSGIQWLLWLMGNHDCHDAETQALTKRGWLYHHEIVDTDEVLSLNTDTGAAEWTPIIKKIEAPYAGSMRRLESRSISALVTGNHRVLHRPDYAANLQYKHAAEIRGRIGVPLNGSSVNGEYPLTDDQIAIAGWILTDGSISWRGNSPHVVLYQSKDGCEIERLLGALGLQYTKHTRCRKIEEVCGKKLKKPPLPQNEWRLSVDSSRTVLSWLPSKGGLPVWAQELSDRQFDVLLDAIVSGDGCWDGVRAENKSCAVIYGSEEFLSSIQAVAVSHGWCARLSVSRRKDYRLNLCRRRELRMNVPRGGLPVEYYSGIVWCLRVPNGNFMVRRRGAAHFSGNSWGDGSEILRLMGAQQVQMNQTPMEEWQARFRLVFPNGREARIHAAHDFPGHSMWNTLHGPQRAAHTKAEAHLYVAGHKHNWALHQEESASREFTYWLARCRGYKFIDHYGENMGYLPQQDGASILSVFDPEARSEASFVQCFADAEAGGDYLQWLRNRSQRSAPTKLPSCGIPKTRPSRPDGKKKNRPTATTKSGRSL